MMKSKLINIWNYLRDIVFNQVLVILFGYDAPGDRNLEGKLAKRHIKSYWENYEKTYGMLLRSASNIELNETNVDLYKNGFVRFIKAAYFACTQVSRIIQIKISN